MFVTFNPEQLISHENDAWPPGGMCALRLQLTHDCMPQTSTARKGRDSEKAQRIPLPLTEAHLFPDDISYPTEPFNIGFKDDVVGRKTAVISLLDEEGLMAWS